MKPVKLEVGMPEWSTFLSSNEHYIFHRPEYVSFIEETFPNIKSHYFAVKDNEKIIGIFPFFNTKTYTKFFPNGLIGTIINKLIIKIHPLFKEKIISAVFNDYGGPCGELNEQQIYDILRGISNKSKLPIEIRQGFEKYDKYFDIFLKINYKRFVLKLTDKTNIWNNIQKEKRKAIKKAKKENVIIEEINYDDIPKLIKLYEKNMDQFGSPNYPPSFFYNFYKYLVNSGLGKCVGAYIIEGSEKRLISALLGYNCSNRVHIIIAISDENYLSLRPNDAVHWKYIEWACDNGYKWFDFGHTRENSGQFSYKEKWGGELKNLYIYMVDPNDLFPNKSKYFKFEIKEKLNDSKLNITSSIKKIEKFMDILFDSSIKRFSKLTIIFDKEDNPHEKYAAYCKRLFEKDNIEGLPILGNNNYLIKLYPGYNDEIISNISHEIFHALFMSIENNGNNEKNKREILTSISKFISYTIEDTEISNQNEKLNFKYYEINLSNVSEDTKLKLIKNINKTELFFSSILLPELNNKIRIKENPKDITIKDLVLSLILSIDTDNKKYKKEIIEAIVEFLTSFIHYTNNIDAGIYTST